MRLNILLDFLLLNRQITSNVLNWLMEFVKTVKFKCNRIFTFNCILMHFLSLFYIYKIIVVYRCFDF